MFPFYFNRETLNKICQIYYRIFSFLPKQQIFLPHRKILRVHIGLWNTKMPERNSHPFRRFIFTYSVFCKFSLILILVKKLPGSRKNFFLLPISVHQADNIQKQVDKVQIQLQRGKYRCFLKQLRICGENLVIVPDLACIVSGET